MEATPRVDGAAYPDPMRITVEELAARLNTEAERRGISAEALLDELLDRLPRQRQLGFFSLGASKTGRTARDLGARFGES